MNIALNLNDATVQAAIVNAMGTIVAAVIAAICATLIGNQITGRRRLQENLGHAIGDIKFLLEVERQHCQMRMEQDGTSLKITVRKRVSESGERWTGRFTPGRSVAKAISLNNSSNSHGTNPYFQ